MLFEAQIARQGTYGALQGGSAEKQFQPRNVRIRKKRVSSTRRPKNSPPDCFLNGLSNPLQQKCKKRTSPEEYPNLFFGALQGIRTPDLLVRSFRLILLLNLIMNYQALRNLAKSRLFQIVLQISLKEQCDSKSKMLEKC